MNFKCIPVGALDTNCYLLEDDGKLVIIDPGAQADRILQALDGAVPKAIIVTHRHWDHISAIPELLAEFDIPVYASEKDADAICDSGEDGNRSQSALMRRYLPGACEIEKIDKRLNEGDVIKVGNLNLHVIETPGHSIGSICLYCPEAQLMFTGDTLFAGGSCGRTDFPTGSMDDMQQTLATKFVDIADNIAIYPGHGPRSSFSAERLANSQLH